jgi:hypothetical protein
MEPTAIAANIYQAGLMFSFALSGADEKTTAAMREVTGLLAGTEKGKADKAFAALEAALIAAEPKVAAHMQELISKSP